MLGYVIYFTYRNIVTERAMVLPACNDIAIFDYKLARLSFLNFIYTIQSNLVINIVIPTGAAKADDACLGYQGLFGC
jgi:hypothetical protein